MALLQSTNIGYRVSTAPIADLGLASCYAARQCPVLVSMQLPTIRRSNVTDSNAQASQLQQVEQLWSGAVKEMPGDPNTKALGLRGNFRVNILQAFKAAFYTVKVYVEGKVALATGSIVTPWELAKLVKGGLDAVVATFRTFYESMSEAEYITCIVLSNADAGLTEAELQSQVQAFVDGVQHKEMPFYLGLTDGLVSNAKLAVARNGAMDGIVKELVKRDFVERKGTRIHFKSKHFEWGFKLV